MESGAEADSTRVAIRDVSRTPTAARNAGRMRMMCDSLLMANLPLGLLDRPAGDQRDADRVDAVALAHGDRHVDRDADAAVVQRLAAGDHDRGRDGRGPQADAGADPELETARRTHAEDQRAGRDEFAPLDAADQEDPLDEEPRAAGAGRGLVLGVPSELAARRALRRERETDPWPAEVVLDHRGLGVGHRDCMTRHRLAGMVHD